MTHWYKRFTPLQFTQHPSPRLYVNPPQKQKRTQRIPCQEGSFATDQDAPITWKVVRAKPISWEKNPLWRATTYHGDCSYISLDLPCFLLPE